MAASLKGELLFVLALYENIAVLDFTLKSLPCRRCLCRNYTGARHHVSAALVCFSARVSMNQLGGKKKQPKKTLNWQQVRQCVIHMWEEWLVKMGLCHFHPIKNQ